MRTVWLCAALVLSTLYAPALAGIGLLATGALNIFWSGMFLGYKVEEAFDDNEETGHTICLVMLGVGAAQVVGGGIMALVGHSKAASALTRVSLTPVAMPGGGALMLGGRF